MAAAKKPPFKVGEWVECDFQTRGTGRPKRKVQITKVVRGNFGSGYGVQCAPPVCPTPIDSTYFVSADLSDVVASPTFGGQRPAIAAELVAGRTFAEGDDVRIPDDALVSVGNDDSAVWIQAWVRL